MGKRGVPSCLNEACLDERSSKGDKSDSDSDSDAAAQGNPLKSPPQVEPARVRSASEKEGSSTFLLSQQHERRFSLGNWWIEAGGAKNAKQRSGK